MFYFVLFLLFPPNLFIDKVIKVDIKESDVINASDGVGGVTKGDYTEYKDPKNCQENAEITYKREEKWDQRRAKRS